MAINLLPRALAEAERLEEIKKLFKTSSLAFLAGVVLVAAGTWAYSLSLSSEVEALNRSLITEEENIRGLAPTEEKIRSLALKAQVLDSHFKKAPHYSLLLATLLEVTPPEIALSTFSLTSPAEVTLSGTTQTYASLAHFLAAIVDGERGGKIFKEVFLTSVSADPQTGGAKFVATLVVKKGALYESSD